ncbi:MAG: aryl-sulfate sulfotransferase [Saprospiraceae bacterium]|nr:aryl-sulfate sulfotransferase [Saprospiraceae bacterium]
MYRQLFSRLLPLITLGLFLITSACKQGYKNFDELLTSPEILEVAPSKRVPMGAMVTFQTKEPVSISYAIPGASPINRKFSTPSIRHEIPIIGLYPDTVNHVQLTATTATGKNLEKDIEVAIGPVPDFLPDIDIVKADRNRMEPGMHLTETLIAVNGRFTYYILVFDDQGVIRWYLDLSEFQEIVYSPLRIHNGHWFFVHWQQFLELDDLGREVSKGVIPGYGVNHEVVEVRPNVYIMGASRADTKVYNHGREVSSRFDHIIEWDRTQNKVTWEWDMRDVEDVDRQVFPPDYGQDFAADWFHVNSIIPLNQDQGLIVSGRNQGVIKIDRRNNLQWILAPHQGWEKGGFDGNGLDTRKYLLQAVGDDGKPYPEPVQQGVELTDFVWPTGQHSVHLLGNGHLLMFDNGLSPAFQTKERFSRAVEYQVDEANKTVQQVWSFGREEGLDLFSPVTSSVYPLEKTGNLLITAGNVRLGELPPHARMLEVTYPDKEVVFEANLYLKDARGTKAAEWAQFDLVYRGHRYQFIP